MLLILIDNSQIPIPSPNMQKNIFVVNLLKLWVLQTFWKNFEARCSEIKVSYKNLAHLFVCLWNLNRLLEHVSDFWFIIPIFVDLSLYVLRKRAKLTGTSINLFLAPLPRNFCQKKLLASPPFSLRIFFGQNFSGLSPNNDSLRLYFVLFYLFGWSKICCGGLPKY